MMKRYFLYSTLLLVIILAVACQSQTENNPYQGTQGQDVNITDLPIGNLPDDRMLPLPNVSQDDIDLAKELSESGEENDIFAYCEDNHMSCVFYCHDNQDNEFCMGLVPERPIPEELK